MSDSTCFVLFDRKYCPSGRVIRKYVSSCRRGWTENYRRAWFTTDREEAEDWARRMDLDWEERELQKPTAKFGQAQTPAIGKAVRR